MLSGVRPPPCSPGIGTSSSWAWSARYTTARAPSRSAAASTAWGSASGGRRCVSLQQRHEGGERHRLSPSGSRAGRVYGTRCRQERSSSRSFTASATRSRWSAGRSWAPCRNASSSTGAAVPPSAKYRSQRSSAVRLRAGRRHLDEVALALVEAVHALSPRRRSAPAGLRRRVHGPPVPLGQAHELREGGPLAHAVPAHEHPARAVDRVALPQAGLQLLAHERRRPGTTARCSRGRRPVPRTARASPRRPPRTHPAGARRA